MVCSYLILILPGLFLLISAVVDCQGTRENEVVADIEINISSLEKKTKESRSESSKKRIEKIMLRVAGTGMMALSRNEIFAESQTVFQDDDLEEEIPGDAEKRSQYVPTVGFGEPLFTVPSSYLLQVVGRALIQAGFVSGEVLGLKSRTLPCNLDDWRSDYQQYRATYHPSVQASLPPAALKYRLDQFLRRAKTDLGCLDGDIQSQLDIFRVVLSDHIETTARGSQNVRDKDIAEAILASYSAVDSVRAERKRDWNSVLTLRWVTLLSKLTGLTLVTWGRNIGEWPRDVDLLAEVSTSYYLGISGRALFSILWLLDDFRDMKDYNEPSCGSSDLYNVVIKSEFSPLLSGAPLLELERKLLLVRFKGELKESVSCLTTVPPQFYHLDILATYKAVNVLKDSLDDIIDTIES